MTIGGLLLVLAAAVCHATWNYFVKRLNAGPELVWLFSVVTVVLYLPLAAWFGARVAEFGATELLFIAGSTLLHLAYFLLLQTGYRYGDLSLVYPVARATGPLLSTAFAVAVLGEQLTPGVAIGGGIIVFGVLMLTRGPRLAPEHVMRSLAFGAGTGVVIGSYTVWDAYAVSTLLVPPLLLDYASSVGRSILLAPVARRRWAGVRNLWRVHRPAVVVIALFNPLAYILVLTAMTFTPVVYVAPLRETSVLLSVLAGSLLLGEGHVRARLAWATVILTGVVILAGAG
jgi:uncharacterized membrane protein